MPSKKNPTNTSTVLEARELLTKLVELVQKPGVRNDPVVRALLRGINPGPSAYETASLAISAARNAGALNTGNNSSDCPAPLDSVKDKSKKSGKSVKDKAKPTKLRGFSRSLDVLLEDSVARGLYPDKESHPVAKKLRELRKDPNRMVSKRTLEAVYVDTKLPNGKLGKSFVKLAVDDKGRHVVNKVDKVPVKELSDFDLLALESRDSLDIVKDDFNDLFSSTSRTHQTPEAFSKAYPSLKGTEVLNTHAEGVQDRDSLMKSLSKERFWLPGPSKTLDYEGRTQDILSFMPPSSN